MSNFFDWIKFKYKEFMWAPKTTNGGKKYIKHNYKVITIALIKIAILIVVLECGVYESTTHALENFNSNIIYILILDFVSWVQGDFGIKLWDSFNDDLNFVVLVSDDDVVKCPIVYDEQQE